MNFKASILILATLKMSSAKSIEKDHAAINQSKIPGIRKIHRPHRPQTQYTDLLFSNYFLALGKYTDLLGKYTYPTNHQVEHIPF